MLSFHNLPSAEASAPFPPSQRRPKRLLLLLTILLLQPLAAKAALRSDWGGFISQGWALTDHNAFYGQSSDSNGSFDYRELGLNGFINFNPRTRITGQLLSRTAGETNDGQLKVDYLFGDYSFIHQLQQQAGLRVGRVKNALGFYNEARDVAFTRPGIIMPQSIYFDQVRELQLSSDGVALYYRNNSAYGNWLVDLQHGELQTGNATEARFLAAARHGQFHSSTVSLGRVLFEPTGERWRLGFTFVDAHMPFSPQGDDPFTAGDIDLRMRILSAQYNREHWSFTAEAMRADTYWTDLGPVPPRFRALEAWYLQAEYRLNPRWQLQARFDYLTLDRDDRKGIAFSKLPAPPGQRQFAHQQFAEDTTIGVQYRPNQRWELRAEVHKVDGTAWLSPQDNADSAALERHWQLLILQAAYRF